MNASVELIKKYRISPIKFIGDMWGLIPQPIKPEYKDKVKSLIATGDFDNIQVDWFEEFVKGEHITWQQFLILSAIERACRGEATHRISVRSGHGIGKTGCLSWLLLWYLFCYENSQIPCTAPSADQMYDVLWKEVSLWIHRMPDFASDLYEHQSTHVRMKQSPETWFARAKTARKEAPEALAGIHSDNVMMLCDESSGIPEQIFVVAEGALTSADIFVILISNPTRRIGYFFESHNNPEEAENWQLLAFNSEDSPIVDNKYVTRITQKYGRDSDEYRVRVLGEFPKEDAIDDKGYTALYKDSDVVMIPENLKFLPGAKMGIDPAGEGDDETVWVIRDNVKSVRILGEKKSTPKGIAQKTVTLLEMYKIMPNDVYVDNFGVGANVVKELAMCMVQAFEGKQKILCSVNGINVGDRAEEFERYINKRAECFYRGKNWMRNGGEFVENKHWKELFTIRYRPELSGKLKIMGKQEMRNEGYLSPNTADAWMLTFWDENFVSNRLVREQELMNEHIDESNKYDLFTL